VKNWQVTVTRPNGAIAMVGVQAHSKLEAEMTARRRVGLARRRPAAPSANLDVIEAALIEPVGFFRLRFRKARYGSSPVDQLLPPESDRGDVS
jgi:hypothetical protein